MTITNECNVANRMLPLAVTTYSSGSRRCASKWLGASLRYILHICIQIHTFTATAQYVCIHRCNVAYRRLEASLWSLASVPSISMVCFFTRCAGVIVWRYVQTCLLCLLDCAWHGWIVVSINIIGMANKFIIASSWGGAAKAEPLLVCLRAIEWVNKCLQQCFVLFDENTVS